jgi:hypothetical protein
LAPCDYVCCIYNDTHPNSLVTFPRYNDGAFPLTILSNSLCGYASPRSFSRHLMDEQYKINGNKTELDDLYSSTQSMLNKIEKIETNLSEFTYKY